MRDRIRVLYVDDEPGFLEIGRSFLENSEGLQVDTLTSAPEALSLPAIREFDAIVSDYQMKEMNGIVFLKAIRERFGDIPFILFTGRGREEVVIEAINNGADFYIQKGGDPMAQFAELAHKIRKAVARNDAERELRAAYEQIAASERELRQQYGDLAAAQKKLRESQEQMAEIAESVPGVVYQFYIRPDGSMGFYFVSSRALDVFGISADPELFFDEFSGHTDPRDRNAILHSIKNAASSESPWDIEGRFIRPSGETIWFHGFSRPVKKDKELVYNGVLVDITARKLVEEALEKRLVALTRPLGNTGVAFEDLFNLSEIQKLQDDFATAAGIAMLLTCPDGTPITRPSNFCRLCSEIVRRTPEGVARCYASDSELGKIHRENPYIHTCLSAGLCGAGTNIVVGDRHIANWLIGQVRNEALVENDLRAYAQEIGVDEEEFIRAFHEVPVMSPAHFASIAQALATIANLLSRIAYQNVQQARFIADRNLAEEALRVSEEKYRRIIENLQDSYIRTDENGVIVMASPSAARLHGYTSTEEMVGLRPASLYNRPGQFEEALRILQEKGYVTDFSAEGVRKDGTTFWLSLNLQYIRDGEGRLRGCEAIVRDISERREMERAIQEANRKLGLLNSITRHDIANQLTMLHGLTYLATKQEHDPVMAGFLEKIEAATDRIQRQVEFMKTYQELELRAPGWFRLDKTIADVGKKEVRCMPGCAEVEIFSDPMLERVFYNLFENALRHGEHVTEIIIGCRDGPDGLVINVEDNGIGIPAGIKGKIFDKGFGKHTGFGLFLAREILAITGMTIRETGTPGSGARFEILVPKGKYRIAGG